MSKTFFLPSSIKDVEGAIAWVDQKKLPIRPSRRLDDACGQASRCASVGLTPVACSRMPCAGS